MRGAFSYVKTLRAFVVVSALVASSAFAQDIEASEPVVTSGGSGQGWSMLAGRSVGKGATVVSVQAGWPGLHIGALHGIADKVDVGGRVSFNYGFEGMVNYVVPGVKLQGVVRAALLERDRFNFGLEFAPGPLFYFGTTAGGVAGTTVGLALPFSFSVGIPVGSAILLHFPIEIPMFVTFGSAGGLFFPVLVGGGVEYFIDRSLAATFKLRMGPTVDTNDYRRRGSAAYFTLETMIGIEYRL